MTDTRTTTPTTEAKGGNVIPLPTQPEQSTTDIIRQFVRDHPVMVIAGGLAIGVVAAAILPKRSRRFLARRATRIAEAVGSAGLLLGQRALDRAEATGSGVRARTNLLTDRAERLGNAAIDRVETWSDSALDTAARLNPFRAPEPVTLGERLAARASAVRHRVRG